MARLTVEDCLDHVDNRYDLVLLATKRTRQIGLGAELFVDEENDKPTVIALREIAANFINQDNIDTVTRRESDEDFAVADEFDISTDE